MIKLGHTEWEWPQHPRVQVQIIKSRQEVSPIITQQIHQTGKFDQDGSRMR